ncbi:hypothetical protein, partial [Mycobacterium sp. URHB0044]|uniref:hypothetical protein n=1 Tax=Mycobacterium sp. URHB0044 TaxID=1380386 RepID=UPI00056466E9
SGQTSGTSGTSGQVSTGGILANIGTFIASVWHSTVTFLGGLFASFLGLLFGFRQNAPSIRRNDGSARSWWF